MSKDKIEPVHEPEVFMNEYEKETKWLQTMVDATGSVRQMAEAIFEANKIIEDSYDRDTEKYLISTEDGVRMACQKYGIPQFARILFLAFSSWSNDCVEWAERVLGREEGSQPPS